MKGLIKNLVYKFSFRIFKKSKKKENYKKIEFPKEIWF